MRPQAWFALFVVALFAVGLYDSLQHSFLGGVFPVMVTAVMLPPAIYLYYVTARNQTGHSANYDHEIVGDHVGQEGVAGLTHYLWWLGGFLASTILIGFWISILGFFLIFLRVKARASWTRTAILTAAGVGFITALAWIMVLDFPRGYLQDAIDLPWPIG